MLSKYDYEKLADEISDDFMADKGPLSEGIKVTAIKMELNPEQIKRLTESTNIKTYNKMFDAKEDKTFDFEVGDSKKIIDEVYSDTSEKDDKVETEIKDMPPVEFKPESNPKAPEKNYQVLGDDNELEVSKNTVNSEDAAGDTLEDSLKIPKKDYSYSEDTVMDSESEEENEDVMSEEDEEDREKEKTASLKKIAHLEEIKKELDHRILLLTDKVLDETSKTASLFMGFDKHEKFASFVANTNSLYGNEPVYASALDLVKDRAHINTSVVVSRPKFNKFASVSEYGVKNFRSLLDTFTEYDKTFRAKELLESGNL